MGNIFLYPIKVFEPEHQETFCERLSKDPNLINADTMVFLQDSANRSAFIRALQFSDKKTWSRSVHEAIEKYLTKQEIEKIKKKSLKKSFYN